MTSVLDRVRGQIATGQAPDGEQLAALADTTDLVALGLLGDQARRRRHGDRTTFVRVAEVRASDAGHATWPPAAGELRLVGVPASADEAVHCVRTLVARAGHVPVTGWSLGDLEQLAGSTDGLVGLVSRLHDAGLTAIAEATIDALADAHGAIVAVARAGGRLARVTFRQPGSLRQALAWLGRVRSAQHATGVVRVVAPLPRIVDTRQPTTGYDDAKLVALARLALDNVASIQVDWALAGPKAAQVALLFGADDIDAVPAADEDVAQIGRRRTVSEEIRRNITAASLVPVERDARWAVVAA